MVLMEQVHGNTVVRVDNKDEGRTIKNCDALISNDPEVILSVRVADCLPISIIDKKSHSFGLIHAGWRGLDNGIIGKTIALMVSELKIGIWNLKIYIGPHICQKHYEVKSDVSEKFREYPASILQKDGKDFLNLAKVAELQLTKEGINKRNINIDKRCTFEDLSLPSFRRDNTSSRLNIRLSLT